MSRLRSAFAILSILYISQFISFSMLMVVTPVAMRQHGAEFGQISLIYGAGLIWAAKALFAPFLDRLAHRMGTRIYVRTALLAHIALALTTFMLSTADPLNAPLRLIVLSYVVALCMTFQDNATDALSVRLIPQSHRLLLGTLQAISGKLGYLLGAAGGLFLYAHLGWEKAVLVLLVPTAIGVPALLLVPMPETDASAADMVAWSRFRGSVAKWFTTAEQRVWLGSLFSLYAGIMAMSFLAGPLLVDHGWQPDRIALVKDFTGALAGIATGLLALAIMRSGNLLSNGNLSDQAIIGIIAVGQWGLAFLFIAAHQTQSMPMLIAAAIGLMAVLGLSQGLVYAMIFKRCAHEHAATDFAVQYSVMAMGSMIVGIALTRFVGVWGYDISFLIAALCPALSLWLGRNHIAHQKGFQP